MRLNSDDKTLKKNYIQAELILSSSGFWLNSCVAKSANSFFMAILCTRCSPLFFGRPADSTHNLYL